MARGRGRGRVLCHKEPHLRSPGEGLLSFITSILSLKTKLDSLPPEPSLVLRGKPDSQNTFLNFLWFPRSLWVHQRLRTTAAGAGTPICLPRAECLWHSSIPEAMQSHSLADILKDQASLENKGTKFYVQCKDKQLCTLCVSMVIILFRSWYYSKRFISLGWIWLYTWWLEGIVPLILDIWVLNPQ